ncbi:hypothetical protein BKA69DRAFT_1104526 [Paraphysoderma sedebokerense]|nr:hypothetical protein BKA69DRAFT_1104526 [Paraphysoderma sedebokerense]
MYFNPAKLSFYSLFFISFILLSPSSNAQSLSEKYPNLRTTYGIGLDDLATELKDKLTKMDARDYPARPGTCGDKTCDLSRGEYCRSCPEDCGGCPGPKKIVFDCKNPKHVALTFDDGPTEFTPIILDELKKVNGKATFFVVGQRLRHKALTDILIRTHKEGHLIGSHSWDHRNFQFGNGSVDLINAYQPPMTYTAIRRELLYTDIAIASRIGKRPLFFRFPYTSSNSTTHDVVQSLGYIISEYNVNSFDTVHVDKANGAEIILGEMKKATEQRNMSLGVIALQHDILARSAYLVADVIQYYKSLGFEFVTFDVCMGEPSGYRPDGSYFRKLPPFTSSSIIYFHFYFYFLSLFRFSVFVPP